MTIIHQQSLERFLLSNRVRYTSHHRSQNLHPIAYHGQVRNVCYNLGETHSPKDQRIDFSQLRLLKGRLEPSRRLAPSVISLARGTQLPRRGHRLIKYRRGAKKRVGNAYTYRFGAGQRRQSWQSSGTWR